VIAGDEAIAERGVESVQNYVDGDVKANFSFFPTITAEGERLPLILITKQKSTRCHKQFARHDAHRFGIWHSPSGWSTKIFI
jgi:hypothetical protein